MRYPLGDIGRLRNRQTDFGYDLRHEFLPLVSHDVHAGNTFDFADLLDNSTQRRLPSPLPPLMRRSMTRRESTRRERWRASILENLTIGRQHEYPTVAGRRFVGTGSYGTRTTV